MAIKHNIVLQYDTRTHTEVANGNENKQIIKSVCQFRFKIMFHNKSPET